MKKKLAILLASLSLCACSFIGCSDDDKKNDDKGEQNIEKAAEGEKCGASADGKECKEDTLECVKKGGEGEDANEFICKKKEQGAEKAAEGEKCGASADGKECKEDTLECVKKGGEGEDANEFICKKIEQKGGDIAYEQDCDVADDKCADGLKCEQDASTDPAKCVRVAGAVCSDANDLCEDGYACQEDPLDGKFKCVEESSKPNDDDDPYKGIAVCDYMVECAVEGYSAETCHPTTSGDPAEPVVISDECKAASKAYNECKLNAECSELVADQLALASCKDEYVANMVACSGMKDKDDECVPNSTDASTMCVSMVYVCKAAQPEDASGVCVEPVAGDTCHVAAGCAGGANGNYLCVAMIEGSPYGMCKIKDGQACTGANDMNCASGGYGNCIEDTSNPGEYICKSSEAGE